MDLQTAAVILIIAGAVGFIGLSAYRKARSGRSRHGKCGSDCGCG
jgi:hypothetical protein